MRTWKLFWVGMLATAASCVQLLDGDHPYSVEGVPAAKEPCETAADCDDNNACTTATCSDEKICVYTPTTDGTSPVQTVGDCQRLDCAAGKEVTVTDDADIPDDNEPCTNDACQGGTPSNTHTPDGGVCQRGNESGTCQGGVCQIACDAQNPCDDGNACTDDFCNFATSICVFTNLDGLPTPGVTPTPGDCKQRLCINGKDTDVTDDTDVPVDMNTCTFDVCTMGAPTNPPVLAGDPCEPGKPEVCDGTSNCVACNEPADCVLLPPDDVCQKRTCENHVCVQTFAPAGTTFDSQTAGDCMRVVCDGAGATEKIVDDIDLPNDNNACTKNVCTNGTPTFPNEATNTACGAGIYCDGAGQCVGCNEAAQCEGTDDFCKVRTCIDNQCGVSFTPKGTDLPNGQTARDCKVIECDGQGNIVTSTDTTDKPVDGNECTDDMCSPAGVPSNPNRPVDAACNQNGGTVCNGAGACKKAPAQTCGGAVECLSGHCVDGVCCNAACSGTCMACNVAGNVGTCTNVFSGMDDSPTCTGSNSCNGGGQCKKEQGVSCSASSECLSGNCVDGVCCESACTATCQSCGLAGNEGVCANIPAGQEDLSSVMCTNTQACDGNGLCKKKNGSSCSSGVDCLSGKCGGGTCMP
ncbi:hypothetical protein [Polyangium jinanense]|uniref:Tryptophan synthase alpha chain n=1 Tax=Polyangium jinanense TaxID=2829994 RepID=A0A9X3XED7_9BACT|nr:hypothetical protein [Polyangium jinanense]MDC3962056.1 hypothetical protein [Polyangium jinanense]MDC3988772.1 hypothetical protein [Polyangium jinanense]